MECFNYVSRGFSFGKTQSKYFDPFVVVCNEFMDTFYRFEIVINHICFYVLRLGSYKNDL